MDRKHAHNAEGRKHAFFAPARGLTRPEAYVAFGRSRLPDRSRKIECDDLTALDSLDAYDRLVRKRRTVTVF
jgi:hypothetical protein